MKQEILQNLSHPRQLEKLYRENKATFRKEFNMLYPEVNENTTAQIWYE